ncbi:M57 family metalloprotease [Arcticibacter tournemirensis]|nr:M57 family metalloprotease [Arcticibacter tournemirensis]
MKRSYVIFTLRKPNKIFSGLNKTIGFLSFLLLCFYGCKKVESVSGKEESQEISSDLAFFKQNGFDIDSIKELDEYYLIENDMMVSRKRLKEALEGNKTKSAEGKTSQYNTFNLVSNYSNYNINVYVEQSIWTIPDWYGGLNTAISAWNSIPGSNIKLHLISDDYNASERADIIVRADGGVLADDEAARAEFPVSSGRPGSVILVNTDIKDPYTNYFLNMNQTAWNMIHEIGHCLGLRHTNWYFRNEGTLPYGAIHVPGTPATEGDPFSVMNGGTALRSCTGNCLSAFDITAITSLYPINPNSPLVPIIRGLTNFNSGQTNFYVSYYSNEPNINYSWEVIGINGTNHYDNSFDAMAGIELSLPPGNYKIKCTISGGKFGTAVAQKDVHVFPLS